jgi:hypothetical protein
VLRAADAAPPPAAPAAEAAALLIGEFTSPAPSPTSANRHPSPAPGAPKNTRIPRSITFTTVALYIDSANPRHPAVAAPRQPAPLAQPAVACHLSHAWRLHLLV